MVSASTRVATVPIGQAPSVRKFCRQQGLDSPRQRLEFFQSADALHLFSADVVAQQTERLLKERRRLRHVVASASWHDAAWDRNEPFPPGGDDTSMALSKSHTRWDTEDDGLAHRRWLPPQCRAEEDYIDGLEPKEAAFLSLHWPASPSAVAIFRHLTMTKAALNRSLDNGGREGRGRSTANAKRK
jgi:hypothetical protein